MKENNALLRLDGVGFKTDDAVILHNINFQLRAGEFKLITGPSGCGKSTLLKIIASLLSPTSGRLFFDDADVATLSPERYRQQVSYCAQTPALFGDSVYDNLIFPWQIRNKQPDPQALLADLQRFGLDENMLEKSINELSGGEKQRVSLIRNLQFLPRREVPALYQWPDDGFFCMRGAPVQSGRSGHQKVRATVSCSDDRHNGLPSLC